MGWVLTRLSLYLCLPSPCGFFFIFGAAENLFCESSGASQRRLAVLHEGVVLVPSICPLLHLILKPGAQRHLSMKCHSLRLSPQYTCLRVTESLPPNPNKYILKVKIIIFIAMQIFRPFVQSHNRLTKDLFDAPQ